MLTDRDSRDPLNWLSTILWPDRSTTIGHDESSAPTWWASPSVDQPKILIPARSTAAARTAVKRYHDGFTPALRARSLTAEALMAGGPLARLALHNKGVSIRSGDGPADPGVLDALQDLMKAPELHVAVSLSTPKSNQKPVLQLLDGRGRCLGWAKVSWNDRTEALVANEAQWLQRRPRVPLSMPSLLHDVELAGQRVVISSGVEASRRPRRSPATPPAPDVFLAVSELGSVARMEIQETPWWRSVERVLDVADRREEAAITRAVSACDGLRFRVGAWHGDLTPWNLMTTADRVHLIDWEFAADGVPLGFDLCHFHTQVAAELKSGVNRGDDRRHGAGAALDRSARLSPQGLAALGVEPENRLPVWRLYLVELVRRYLALRAAGYPVDLISHGPAALLRLERALGYAIDETDSGDLVRARGGERRSGSRRTSDRGRVGDGGRRADDRPEQHTESPTDGDREDKRPPASLGTRSDIGQAIAEDIGMGFTIGRRDNGAGVR